MLKTAQDYGSARAIYESEKGYDLAMRNQFAVTSPKSDGYREQAKDDFTIYEKLLKLQTDMRAADPNDPRLAQVEADMNEARARWAAYNDMMTRGAAAPTAPAAPATTSSQPGAMGAYVPRTQAAPMAAMPAVQAAPVPMAQPVAMPAAPVAPAQSAPFNAAPPEDPRVTRARWWVTPKLQQQAAAWKAKQAELKASDPSQRVRLAHELQAIRSAIQADTSQMQEGLAPLVFQALGLL
jgi:hypothetical protein